jgi:hypothetical protein
MAARNRPWTGISAGIADRLRPAVTDIAEVALFEIGNQVPVLGSDLAGEFGQALRRGIDLALHRLLDLFGTEEPGLDDHLTRLYEGFGERESRHGRPLDALLAAYRIGARVSWAQLSAAAVRAEVGVEQLVVLAESIFVYIDELSGASAAGHARHHAAASGYRDVQRSRLAAALVEGQAATAPELIRELADDVAWPVPARMAVAVVPMPPPVPGRAAALPLAPPDVLTLNLDGEVLAVLPDPSGPGRRARLTALVGPGAEVYVGTVRPPQEAPISLAHARAVHRLVLDGVLPRARVVAAADHLTTMVLHADPRLLADLTSRALAPLAGLPPQRQRVLAETLRSWLAVQGDRAAAARRLGVHPQTVSYRMTQLAGLLGPVLDDPAARLALTLALEAQPR